MARQSQAPTILLTRPADGSARFAASILARVPAAQIVTAPLLALTTFTPALPQRPYQAILFTSEAAVQAARRIIAEGQTLPQTALCVGDQTAAAARKAGFDARSAQGAVEDLFALIQSENLQGPLLYLHGRDTTGDIAQRLESSGIETVSAEVYAQKAQPLTPEATALLTSQSPILAPVFSPRSAQLLADACLPLAPTSLTLIAISPRAAQGFPHPGTRIAARPDAAAMLDAVVNCLSIPAPP